MTKNKKRIGFLSFWGWGRGQCYVTRSYAKMIQDEYDVFILKQGDNEILKEFTEIKATITEYKDYIVPKEFFKAWVLDNKLDAVIFNEYKQWNEDDNELVQVANELGIQTYGYLVMEKFAKEQTFEYDRVFAPTVSFERFYRVCKVRNFTYVPYSIDFSEFPEYDKIKTDKFTFFHPGGWGGLYNRKNTAKVIEAFIMLDDDETELIITSQKLLNKEELPKNVTIVDKNLSRKELLKYYRQADAVILPSKWETIGLPILEALASGVPVITNDLPPMNEFIVNNTNGKICKVDLTTKPDIGTVIANVDAEDIKKQMLNIINPVIYEILLKNTRTVAEKLYDLEKNKHYLIDFLKEDLK